MLPQNSCGSVRVRAPAPPPPPGKKSAHALRNAAATTPSYSPFACRLPREPTRFKLIINLTTAKALGVAVPLSFLSRAHELIE
jgi:hypothetical protein